MRFSTLAAAVLAFASLAPAASAQSRLRGTPSTPSKPVEALGGGIVGDGSFETGTPNASWTEASVAFGTPVCSVAACGTGGAPTGPRTGTFWTWFGGSATGDVGSMEQAVTIPAAPSASLKFWLQIPTVASAAPTDFVAVKIDGVEVFRATYGANQATYATYALVTVPINSYANGASHLLRFESTTTGGGNLFVDDVSIEATPAGASLSVTPAAVSFGSVGIGSTQTRTITLTNNGSSAATITSATVTGSPAVTVTGITVGSLAAGASQTGTVTFSPTAAGPATATLSIASNAPGSPLTVAITGTGDAATGYPSADTPITIPDNAPAGITSTITIPASVTGTISDLNVDLNITHTWDGDLILNLTKGALASSLVDRPGVAPGGTGFGCQGDNMVIIVDDQGTTGSTESSCVNATGYTPGGRYTPNTPLSAFNATPAAGTYTLTVSDNGPGDLGTLNSWALLVTTGGVAGEGTASALASRLSVAPNPMRGASQIDLTVGTAQDVRVALYDALGREVAVLLDRSMTAGQQAYVGVDTSSLPSGVYVVRATGTDLNLTQRVTVVR